MNVLKKIGKIALKVVTWALIVFSVFIMIFTVVTITTADRNERHILGVRMYIVASDSMSKSENNKDMKVHFSAGDIIMSHSVNPEKLKEGDIISFISANPDSFGETVTHMIRSVERDGEGNLIGFETFGTNTGVSDEKLVEPSYVLGKYFIGFPGLGNFFAFIKTTPGYISCILLPFLLLILYNGINVVRLFGQYRKEQTALLEAERAEAAKQKDEMQRELEALKAQLEMKNADSSSPIPDEAPASAEAPTAEAADPLAEETAAEASAEGESTSTASTEEAP